MHCVPLDIIGPELDDCFRRIEAEFGVHGSEIRQQSISAEQPIRWSITDSNTKSGIGIQKTWGEYYNSVHPNAFAIHWKRESIGNTTEDLAMWKQKRGCCACYDSIGKFQLGYNHNQAIVD
jgi:hypothetical protein